MDYSINEPLVSVGIMAEPAIGFGLLGTYTLTPTGTVLSGTCYAVAEPNGIRLTTDGQSVFFDGEIELRPSDFNACAFELTDVVIGIDFHWEQKENQRFQGSLKLIPENGKVRAINILPVESYLTSVISSEMSATSSLELLKAHAVISRSWLLAQIAKSDELRKSSSAYRTSVATADELIKWYDREAHTTFDVCADDHCQRYQGITKAHTPEVRLAIELTYGTVLMHDHKICDTRFSKCCGGASEQFENAWEPTHHPYLAQVIDHPTPPAGYDLALTHETAANQWIRTSPPAFCNTTDKTILSQVLLHYDQTTVDFYRWRVTYTRQELSELAKIRSGIDFGEITDLLPLERGQSGRIVRLKIVGTKRTMIIGKELEIRRTLSKSHLYSSAFVVDKQHPDADGKPGTFVLTGAGWGHGVGLCQIGAAVMGSRGYTYDQILLHYFTGATLTQKYTSPNTTKA